MLVRLLQPWNAPLPILVTVFGTTTVAIDLSLNAPAEIVLTGLLPIYEGITTLLPPE